MFHQKSKCPQAAPPEHMGQLPKASLNTEILRSLSNVSLHSSHCPKRFQRTEKQMKYANFSQTDKNQTKEEPATVVIEELLFSPRSHLPPACWEYGKPLEKNAGSSIIQKDSYLSCMAFNFSQIYVLEENIYPLRPYQLTTRNRQVKYCLRRIINSISHWKNDKFVKYHRTQAKRSRWNGSGTWHKLERLWWGGLASIAGAGCTKEG